MSARQLLSFGAAERIQRASLVSVLSLLLLMAGCRPAQHIDLSNSNATGSTTQSRLGFSDSDLRSIVLIPVRGDSPLDKQIALAQQKVRMSAEPVAALEQLGWLFVAKARVSFDPGFYKLAEQCALAMNSGSSNSPESLLLRGHVLQSLHRFKEAEGFARELVSMRGRSFDYGLLGDVLMEQGRLNEAIEAYQKMADLKPDVHAYTRAAHVRWIRGDLTGAIEVMERAITASSPRDAETAAWVCSRMAWYRWHAGQPEMALRYCAGALEMQKDYPPALLLNGRILLATGRPIEAIEPLALAAKMNPLPEYQWVLADAFREAGKTGDAEAVELQLKRTGAAADPRTFALFLATRAADFTTAVRLAKAELDTRSDVFTQDALAWSLAAAGRWDEAGAPMQRALAEGTEDARLFLHAAVIASHSARRWDALGYLRKAAASQQTLLPSEKALLAKYSSVLTDSARLNDSTSSGLKKISHFRTEVAERTEERRKAVVVQQSPLLDHFFPEKKL